MIFITLLWITRKIRWGVGGRRGMMESATYPCSSRPHLWHTRSKFSNGVMDLGILGSTKTSTEVSSLVNTNSLKTLLNPS